MVISTCPLLISIAIGINMAIVGVIPMAVVNTNTYC